MTYAVGHIKQDPVTGAAAIRTIFPDDGSVMAAQAWLIATPNAGARNAQTSDVSAWNDLYIPTAEGS